MTPVTDAPVQEVMGAPATGSLSQPLPAPPDAEAMQELAAHILAGDAFGGEKEVVGWRWEWRNGFEWPDGESSDKSSLADMPWLQSLADAIGSLSHVLLWMFVLLLLLYVWRQRHRVLALRSPTGSTSVQSSVVNVTPLLHPDALPADITAAAQTLWNEGERREALSLLYRAALHRLGNEFAFAVPVSGTESECQRLVDSHVGGDRARAFRQLVAIWVRCAWAHEFPPSLNAVLTSFHGAITRESESAALSAGHAQVMP